jgi:SEC-C motif
VEKIGRNEECRCGSGRKYKSCCEKKDQARLKDSSCVAGVTRAELAADRNIGLTAERLKAMPAAELLSLDPMRVPETLRVRYLLQLGDYKLYDKMVEAFEKLGVEPKIRNVWSYTFNYLSRVWRPDLARRLMLLVPNDDERLGTGDKPDVCLLLAGDDPAAFLKELERGARAALESGYSDDLRDLVSAVLDSPYHALAILLGHGLLPVEDEEQVEQLYDAILAARAKLDLSADDEFNEWMNERALRKAREHETAAVQEAQDKLALTAKEARRAKENNARLEREIALLKKRERSSDEAKASPASFDPVLSKIRELAAEKKRAQALAREKGEAELKARRELERLTKENEDLRAAANGAKNAAEEEEEGREDFEVSGKQPVRPIAFPKTFHSSLMAVKPAAARATMHRLGRIAAGEAAAFDKLKAIIALPGVLEARISDRYRLFFSLLPNCVRVVDLIYRAEMDKKIDHYKLAGLPPVPEFE